MTDGHTAAIVAAIAILASTFAGSASAAAPLGSITEFPVSAGTVPYGITAGADGNLWFTDVGATPSIGRITPAGVMTEFSIGLNVGSAPNGIALGPDGNVWFADRGTTKAIGKITPAGVITEYSGGLNMNSSPSEIAPGPDGNMWFTDGGATKAIGRITPTGTITEYTVPGAPNLYFIAPGPDGNVWFTQYGATEAVGKITPTGTISQSNIGLNPGGVPTGIARGSDGNLWFTDQGTTKAIGRITPTGTITEVTAGLNPGAFPYYGMTAGPDGNLWFGDQGTTPAVGRVNPTTQAITEFSAGLNPGSSIYGITAGPDGNVWFADDGNTKAIGRIGTEEPPAPAQTPPAAPLALPTAAPRLRSLRLAPTTFRTAASGPSARATPRKRPPSTGTVVSFTIDVAGAITYRVARVRGGRRVGGRCAAPTRSNRRATRCTRFVALSGSFTRSARSGRNSFRFTGRIGGRRLAPGSYQLRASPRAGGRNGTTVRASFRVVR